MQKWEYKIVKLDVYAIEKDINRFGQEGGELAALLPTRYKGELQNFDPQYSVSANLELEPTYMLAYFKRQIHEA